MPDVSRILISGYYGYSNPGDEAILAVLLSELRRDYPGAVIRVISGTPDQTAGAHQVETVLWSDPLAIARAVQESDVVITGGGGILHDYGGYSQDGLLSEGNWGIGFHITAGLLANLYGKPHWIWAVGVGPLFTDRGRLYLRDLCAAASMVTVRDEASRELLIGIGVSADQVTLAADPAFLLPRSGADRLNEIVQSEGLPPSPLRVVVAIRHWDHGVDPEKWETQLAQALERFRDAHPDAQLVLLPFQRFPGEQEDDLSANRRFRARLSNPERICLIEGRYSPADMAALIGGAQLVIAMRLHAAIFAISHGVPLIALKYDGKIDQLMKEAEKSHLGIAMPEVTPGSVASAMRQALIEPAATADGFRERAGRTAALARSRTTARPPTEVFGLIRESVESLLKSNAALRFSRADQKINYEYQVRMGEEQRTALNMQIDGVRSELAAECQLHQQHLVDSERLARELYRQLREVEAAGLDLQSRLRVSETNLAVADETRRRLEPELHDVRVRLAALHQKHSESTAAWSAFGDDLNKRLAMYRSQRPWHVMLALRKGYVMLKTKGALALAAWMWRLLRGNGQIETEQLEFPPRPRL